MAKVIKVKGDASDVQTEFNHAPVGLYTGKAAAVEEKKSNNTQKPMVEIRWEVVGNGDGKKMKEDFASVFYYAPLDLTDEDISPGWARRLKELLTAFALPMKGANLGKIEGKNALIRLREDTDQEGEYRPRIGKILPLKDADVDEDEDDEDDENGEDEEDYSEMSLADLKELVEERELEFSGKATKAKLVKLLEEADESEDDEDEDEDDDEDEVDIDSMTRAELKAYIKEEGLDVKVLRKDDEDSLREKIKEAQGEDEDEEDDDEDDEDNYDDLGVAELREELEARSLNTKGAKKALIARLRADDEDEPV